MALIDPIQDENFRAHLPCACTRRDFLFRAGAGLGGLALSTLLAQESALAENRKSKIENRKSVNPLASRNPHFEPKAKAVIFLFMVGGPSQMETFDPKPDLDRMSGQQMAPS